MILLVDNYDSFVYNLYQFIGEALANIKGYDLKSQEDLYKIKNQIKVIRNDDMTIEEIKKLNPDFIFLSPGPGKPENAGICKELTLNFLDKVPIMGICLGHQSICEALGGEIVHAKKLMHGKTSQVELKEDTLFENLSSPITVARYHSLAVVKDTLPKDLKIIAKTSDGEVMAVRYKNSNLYGLQFHPESILTPNGLTLIENFLKLV